MTKSGTVRYYFCMMACKCSMHVIFAFTRMSGGTIVERRCRIDYFLGILGLQKLLHILPVHRRQYPLICGGALGRQHDGNKLESFTVVAEKRTLIKLM